MLRIILVLLCTPGALLFVRAQDMKPTPVTGKIEWIYSYPDGQKLARQTGKPMFVVFRCER